MKPLIDMIESRAHADSVFDKLTIAGAHGGQVRRAASAHTR